MNAGGVLGLNLASVTERIRESTVRIREGEQSIGSGVVWTGDGEIVTNAHVARRSRLQVELADGRVFPGTLRKRDPSRDLAVIRINASGLQPAPVVHSRQLRVGDLVIAVGNPLGLKGAASSGIVHAIGPVQGFEHQSWIQADVRLAPGNSGGPLADARGRIAGINSMINRGMGMAVPSEAVERFLCGEEEQPKLGVTLQATALGLHIEDVEPSGPAARSGLRARDILIGCDDRPVRTPADLQRVLRESRSGHPILIHLIREGREFTAEVLVRP